MRDLQKLADDLFTSVKGYLDTALSPLTKRVADLEARKPEKGEPGQSVTLADVAPVIKEAVKAEVSALPPAQPGRDGEDGKSLTPVDVAPLIAEEVAKAVSAIPVPKNGEPGKDGIGIAGGVIDRDGNLILTLSSGETKNLGRVVGKDGEDGKPVDPEAVAALVREQVAKAVEPLKAAGPGVDPVALQGMVDKAAGEAVAKLPVPKDGKDGDSVDPNAVSVMIASEVERAVAALPKPKDGKDADPEVLAKMVADAVGALPKAQDGKSVSIEDVTPVLADLVAKAVAALPPAKDGKDADPAAIDRQISEGIAKAVAAIPAPKDGKSVDMAEVDRLVEERVAKAIAALPPPKDGKNGLDLVDFLRNADGHLVATLSDGTVKDLGQINGAPGLGFDDMAVDFDGERTITLQFVRGEQTKAFSFTLPIIVDRGVYKEKAEYERGDAISFGGALWICQVAKSAAKPGTNGDWRLAVKKGRDGRDGTTRVVQASQE